MYEPDIIPENLNILWETILLSTRDVSQDIPINFEETIGVVITAACFADGIYSLNKYTCIANLLAFGYRRLVVDLYWLTGDDAGEGMWHLCPSSEGLDSAVGTATTTITTTGSSTTATSTGTTTSTNAEATQSLSTSLLQSRDQPSPKCDKHLDPTSFFAFLSSWVDRTEYNLLASVATIVFNLHTDQSRPATPQGPLSVQAPPKLSSLSGFPNSLIYTPAMLHADRTNLNSSWLSGGDAGDDEARYFEVQRKKDGGFSSVDAWPSGSFLAFDVHRRLILAFGQVDVPGFDPQGDERSIFQPEEIGWPPKAAGDQKCFFDPNITEVKRANTSWAELIDSSSKPFTNEKVVEVTDCGYSIIVNSTLSKDEEYFSLMESTIWSWDKGEPASSPPLGGTPGGGGTKNDDDDMFRCATMTLSPSARWSVSDCNTRYYPACRVSDLPYNWTLGTRTSRYFGARLLCPAHSRFDVPRTPLENRHLRAAAKAQGLSDTDKIWLDFQSLAVPGCWVTGGEDRSCPYRASDFGKKTIIVPTVAAVILLVIAGLMGFAKLGNRRMEKARKRRRKIMRRQGEYEYEGVPA